MALVVLYFLHTKEIYIGEVTKQSRKVVSYKSSRIVRIVSNNKMNGIVTSSAVQWAVQRGYLDRNYYV